MANIVIENFTLPSTCWRCKFLTEEDWRCLVTDRSVYRSDAPKPKWCPLKEQAHGKWLRFGKSTCINGIEYLPPRTCSVCGASPLFHYAEIGGELYEEECFSNYCPKCGARMDGVCE